MGCDCKNKFKPNQATAALEPIDNGQPYNPPGGSTSLGRHHRYTCSRTGSSRWMNFNFWGNPVSSGGDLCGGDPESWKARGWW